MELQEIKFANLDLVYLDLDTNTPHCRQHGAMNKMNRFEDGGGYWRCLSSISNTNDTVCRAGCNQVFKGNPEGVE